MNKIFSFKLGFLCFLCFGVAGYGIVAFGVMPLVSDDFSMPFKSGPWVITIHVFASMVALVLGPFQFSKALRARRPMLHRQMGKWYLGVGVLIGGGAGLIAAVMALGGLTAKLGFTGLALGWLYTGYKAYSSAVNRDFLSHERWIIRNFALTLAAVTLRIYLPGSQIAGIPFDQAYPVIAWACWVPNILLAEWYYVPKVGAATGIPAKA